jgi:hypothetical protein
MNLVINIIISLILGYLLIYAGLYLSLKIQTIILIPILISMNLNKINILEYSSRFMIGIIIGVLHGILIMMQLNIYALIAVYIYYLLSPIELPMGKIYENVFSESDPQIGMIQIKKIQFNLKFANLLGYTIALAIIYNLTN